jgi:hypothetical protein
MKTTFHFGKSTAGYYKKTTAELEVKVEVRPQHIYDCKTGKHYMGELCFSVCGGIWNCRHTDYIVCGQCLDEIKKYVYINKSLFNEIYELWTKYHLKTQYQIPVEDWERIEKLFEIDPDQVVISL